MSAESSRHRSRRRASRRTFMVRRAVAFAIVALIVFGAVRVVGSVTSGDDPVADAEGPGTTLVGSDGTAIADPAATDTGGAQTGDVPTTVADTTPADTGPP